MPCPWPYLECLVCRSDGSFWGSASGSEEGSTESGQEAPYQGGNEQHRQRDQQQTENFPGPNAQPGLGDMRQTGQVVGGRDLICFIRDRNKALKTLGQVWVGSREKRLRAEEVSIFWTQKSPMQGSVGLEAPNSSLLPWGSPSLLTVGPSCSRIVSKEETRSVAFRDQMGP